MKTQLFKRRVLNGNRSDNFLFTAPEGTEEIIENDFFKQEISTDWAVHYAQQTNPVRVAATMRECLEAFPVERINSKYFIGDSTAEDLYYDEISEPSHLSNCVHGSEEENYGTVYFVEVVDATLPASFYMEKEQKAVEYVPFMGWFTTFGRNRNRKPAVVNDTEKRFPAAFMAWRDEENVAQVTATHYSDGDFAEWVEEMGGETRINSDSLLTLDSGEALLFICDNQQELDEAFAEVFGNDTVLVRCIEAVHIDQEGDESLPYTWEVPKGMEIEIGDSLVVESRVGSQHAVVVATSDIYTIERYTATGLSVDEESNRPYCAVVYNCGKL